MAETAKKTPAECLITADVLSVKYLTTRTKNIANREKNKLCQNKQATLNKYLENNQIKHANANISTFFCLFFAFTDQSACGSFPLSIIIILIIIIINDSYKVLFSNQSYTHWAVQTSYDKIHTNIHFKRTYSAIPRKYLRARGTVSTRVSK